jgi:hypothetical protein
MRLLAFMCEVFVGMSLIVRRIEIAQFLWREEISLLILLVGFLIITDSFFNIYSTYGKLEDLKRGGR